MNEPIEMDVSEMPLLEKIQHIKTPPTSPLKSPKQEEPSPTILKSEESGKIISHSELSDEYSENKPVCELCGKSFCSVATLSKHKKIHTDTKNFKVTNTFLNKLIIFFHFASFFVSRGELEYSLAIIVIKKK